MQAQKDLRNGSVSINGNAVLVLKLATVGLPGEYLVITEGRIVKAMAKVEGLSIEDRINVIKAVRGILNAGIKSGAVRKLGKSIWDVSVWYNEYQINFYLQMLETETRDEFKEIWMDSLNQYTETLSNVRADWAFEEKELA